MVGFNAGNIYDTVMRTVARHIGKHIPGSPTVIPVNRPGAGSLAAANQVFNASPRDGTVIGVFNRSIPTEPLLGSSGTAKFDATKFTWIGNVGNEVSVCVTRRETGAKTWSDMITKPMQVAATSTTADTGVYPLLLNNMFGARPVGRNDGWIPRNVLADMPCHRTHHGVVDVADVEADHHGDGTGLVEFLDRLRRCRRR